MKKMLALMMALVMVLSMVACAPANSGETTVGTTEAPVAVPANAVEILNNIWALYGDDEKFAIVGGDPADMNMEGPGSWNMSNAANLTYSLLIPEAELANVDDAASLMHMMNANTFTSGTVHLKDGVNAATFAATMKDTIMNNPWMCGFPERMVIASFGGNYLLIAFGVNDAMTPFCQKLATAYADAAILYDEAIG